MRKFSAPLLLLILTISVFKFWFLPGLLSAFDFVYFSQVMMSNVYVTPYAWDWHPGLDGLAQFFSPYSWVFLFINFTVFAGRFFGVNWEIIERVFYLYPLLILLIFSPIYLFKTIFPKNNFYIFSVLVFSFNTYALILSASQIFLALAYSLIPIIFGLTLKIINNKNFRLSVVLGLVLSFQTMMDTRVAFLTLIILILYFLFNTLIELSTIKDVRKKIHDFLLIILIPGATTVFLHAFWIVPAVLYGKNPVEQLGAAYSSVGAVNYLSFAKFENTISLLHPNWPENIFGKVYFMRPEFLILPILAFSSLLFLNKLKNMEQKRLILFFNFIGLTGAFLAKGNNPPFGGVYIWLFQNVPGFELFRDPAKFYPLIALSYSVLIPFAIYETFQFVNSKFKVQNYIPSLFLILTTLCLILLIRPAFFGQMEGVLRPTKVPNDYQKLETFLHKQDNYFRTLWIPSKQRFAYYSDKHPLISGFVLFNTTNYDNLFKKLRTEDGRILVERSSIKYVVIPNDSKEEIFLEDRKYSDKKYQETVKAVREVSWLKEVDCSMVKFPNCSNPPFGKIRVFEVPNPKDHFYLISNQQSAISNQKLGSKFIDPTKYEVSVENAKAGDLLIFSESFDDKWILISKELKVRSEKFERFNSFRLPKDGTYAFEVYYTPQDWVNIGVVISGLGFIFVIFGLAFLKPKNN